jgi:hypothetical protein
MSTLAHYPVQSLPGPAWRPKQRVPGQIETLQLYPAAAARIATLMLYNPRIADR